MKSILKKAALLVCTALLFSLIPAFSFATELPFTDVPQNAWYYSDVKYAYDYGLISGRTSSTYSPDADLTYAEAVKLAVMLHVGHTGDKTVFTEGNPWYQTYVDYAKKQNIIDRDYEWNASATRAGYMAIFAKALPADALPVINSIQSNFIPDVSAELPEAEAILTLYRAGILEGSGANHLCKPQANIRRSEVAAILTRMSNPAKRIRFNLEGYSGALTQLTAVASASTLTPVKGGTTVLTCTAAGGKAPYYYQWLWGSDPEKLGDMATWNVGFGDDLYGNELQTYTTLAKEASFTFTTIADINTQYLACLVTDSLGNQVRTNTLTLEFKPGTATVSNPSSAAFLSRLGSGNGHLTVGAEMTKTENSRCNSNGIRIYSADGSLLKDYFTYGDYISAAATSYVYQVDFLTAGVTPVAGTTYRYQIYTVVDGIEVQGPMNTVTAR
ncbi:MAG: S-layer homology domain-containing protein [Firmicutes bacterium]|nr:S-layer homology domain-containing protein [Bacillota bacterium]